MPCSTRKVKHITETPITLYYKYVGDEIGFLLESRTEGKKGRYSFIGKNPLAIMSGKESFTIQGRHCEYKCEGKFLESVKTYLDKFTIIDNESVPFPGGAVGCISYDIIRQYEKLPDVKPDVLKMPDLHMMVFSEIIAYDHLHGTISIIALETPDEEGQKRADTKIAAIKKEILRPVPSSIYEFDEQKQSEIVINSNRTKEEYIDMINKAKKYIYDGDIFQVVLSQRLTAEIEERPLIYITLILDNIR